MELEFQIRQQELNVVKYVKKNNFQIEDTVLI